MPTDIALRKRAIDRIGYGMHADIRIGVPQKRRGMRNFHTA
jgi:hypothetical protein